MQSASDYIYKVRLQQLSNPLFPKIDDNLTNSYLPYSQQEALNYLATKPLNYLSCRYFRGSYYWEFVNSNNIFSFEDLEFLYILVSDANYTLIKNKLPFYIIWNTTKQLETVYPKLNYLIDANSISWGSSYSINISQGFTHPFLPTFEFTGNICLLKQTLLYEYQDLKGYYGQKDYQYLSPLRPLALNYPLGISTQSQLTKDDCFIEEAYPQEGESNWVGEYLGYYTNSTYNKHIRFYLYADSNRKFLLQSPPKLDYKGIALESLDLVGQSPRLRIPTSPSIQEFTINQISNPISLIIA